MLSENEVRKALRERVVEFGERQFYVLFREEFEVGKASGLFTSIHEPENRGDGTVVTTLVFEGKNFLYIEAEGGGDSFSH